MKNQRELLPQIIRWIDAGAADLPELNRRVYAELFLMPLDDPLMGLDLPDEAALYE